VRRVLWWYGWFLPRPIVVLRAGERRDGQDYADIAGAARELAGYGLRVLIDGSTNSLPPEVLTTLRQFVLELEPIEPNVPFPGYENGGSFFHSVGYEALARAAVGDGAGAVAAFTRFLDNAYAANRGWAQQAYFNTGALVGTDPLNDSLLAAWGVLHAGFGFRATLMRGLERVGAPAPQFEGATHTFGFMGADVCLEVKGGALQLCGGGWPGAVE
jgi:hypothetical protein